ncbi:MBL fold metallo-hydrolase [Roseicyclus amphidinii]|uniref:MBL fold metallo-hydrolase n=1 Tax=Roseicyclus amphidinii TaxID=3034232 RepID=UPI0024E0DDA5|nr:MBL fold metallo-hydrolase [Roseicyclus sp. Amp-Y-6]
MELLSRRTVLQRAGALGAMAGLAPGLAHAATLDSDLFTSDEAGLLVDSVVVLGERSAVLVDAQFTAANANLLADMIAATGRTLESILITHIHPDHVLGLPILLDRFPQARAYAQTDIQAILAQILGGMHAQIAGGAPAGVFPDRYVVPEALSADHIMLEGERIEILPPMAGDTALITPVHIPGLDTLVATDIAYIDTHLWMEEAATTDGIAPWRDSVAALQAIGAGTVIPGHRKPDSPNDASVFDATLAYLDHWERARDASGTAEEFRARLMEGTEELGFAFAIDRGVAAAFPE